MKKNIVYSMNVTLSLFLMFVGVGVSGCSSEQESATSRAGEPVQALEAFIMDAKPKGAVTVAQARASAVPGKPIVVTGQIGGTAQPFGGSFATFILGDEAIDFCNELHGDTCATPWDACCEDPDKLAAHRVSVQATHEGSPIPGSLKGVGGLKELEHVVVAGTVAPTSTPNNLIIHASGIYLVQNK